MGYPTRAAFLVATITVLLLSSTTGRAQSEEGSPPDRIDRSDIQAIRKFWGIDSGNLANLLKCPAVQDELGITERQILQVQQIRKDMDIAVGKTILALRAAQKGDDMEAIKIALKDVRDSFRGHQIEVLDQRQRKRLLEIGVQAMGPLAVTWPEVGQKLLIGQGQTKYLDEVIQDYRNRQRPIETSYLAEIVQKSKAVDDDARKAAQKTIQELEAQLVELEARADKAIAKLLSGNQKKRFNKLSGEPFDMARLLPPARQRELEQRKAAEKKTAESKSSPTTPQRER